MNLNTRLVQFSDVLGISDFGLVSQFSWNYNEVPHIAEVVSAYFHLNFSSVSSWLLCYEADSGCHVVDGGAILLAKFPLLKNRTRLFKGTFINDVTQRG